MSDTMLIFLSFLFNLNIEQQKKVIRNWIFSIALIGGQSGLSKLKGKSVSVLSVITLSDSLVSTAASISIHIHITLTLTRPHQISVFKFIAPMQRFMAADGFGCAWTHDS